MPVGASRGIPGILAFVGVAIAISLGVVADATLTLGVACALVTLLLAVLAALRRPRLAISLCFALSLLAETKFRQRSASLTLGNSIDWQIGFELAMSGLIALVTACVLLRRRHALRLTFSERFLAAFGALALGSVFWSAYPALTVVRGVQFAILYVFALTAVRELGVHATFRAMRTTTVSYVLIFATLALTIPAAHGQFGTEAGIGRFTWFSVHPITAGIFVSMAILLLLGHATDRESGQRHVLAVVAITASLLLVLVGTNSRGPVLALSIALAALIFRRYAPLWSIVVSATAAATLVALMDGLGLSASALANNLATSRNDVLAFLYRGQTGNEILGLSGRVELWHHARGLFAQSPVFGHGFQSCRGLFLEAVPWAGHLHNAVLQHVVDLGVVGVLLFWIPLLRTLDVGSRFPRGGVVGLDGVRGAAFALTIFFVLISITNTTFARDPSFETVVVMICMMSADRLRERGGTE